MLDGQTQLTAMFGAPERLSKDPRPAPAPVVTPPGSRSKRKWAPANAVPPLSLPPLAKTPKKAVPPGWMRYGLAPALRRCDECGDDVVGVNRADICRGKRGCQALVCDACHVQSRRGQLRAIALRRVAIISSRRRRADGVQASIPRRRLASATPSQRRAAATSSSMRASSTSTGRRAASASRASPASRRASTSSRTRRVPRPARSE